MAPEVGKQSADEGVSPTLQLEHLLKVAASISRDANFVWGEIWSEIRPFLNHGGESADRPMAEPPGGWPQLAEKLWLLKHYIGSIQRICDSRQSGMI